jgi:hypothetical protein
MNKIFICKCFMILVILMVPMIAICQEAFKKEQDCCDYWLFQITGDKSKLNLYLQYQKDSIYIRDDEKSIMCGVECLLKLEGDKRTSKMGANLSLNNSRADIPNPTVEVAALYKILEIFGLSENVHTIVLRDNEGNSNSRKTIKKAYKYYREWFSQLRKIGLMKAREIKLDPLKDKDVYWD